MIDNDSTIKNIDKAINEGLVGITQDVTSSINTIVDLWSLARITKDIKGDPIWDALCQLGCNPEPLDKLGYRFDYSGYKCLYVPHKYENEVVRFALPKLANCDQEANAELNKLIHMANSLVRESKFTILGEEVWLVYERFISNNEDYLLVVEHILKNLKSGAELFHSFS